MVKKDSGKKPHLDKTTQGEGSWEHRDSGSQPLQYLGIIGVCMCGCGAEGGVDIRKNNSVQPHPPLGVESVH